MPPARVGRMALGIWALSVVSGCGAGSVIGPGSIPDEVQELLGTWQWIGDFTVIRNNPARDQYTCTIRGAQLRLTDPRPIDNGFLSYEYRATTSFLTGVLQCTGPGAFQLPLASAARDLRWTAYAFYVYMEFKVETAIGMISLVTRADRNNGDGDVLTAHRMVGDVWASNGVGGTGATGAPDGSFDAMK